MNMDESIEERALRENRVEFVRRLNVDDYVLDYIFQEGGLSDIACDLIRSEPSRSKRAAALLDSVIQKSIIPLFMKSLKCQNSHTYLASLLTHRIQDLQNEQQCEINRPTTTNSPSGFSFSFGSSFSTSSCCETNHENKKRRRSRSNCEDLNDPDEISLKKVRSASMQIDREDTRNEMHCAIPPYGQNVTNSTCFISSRDEDEDEEKMIIHQPPRKVDIMDRKKKVLTRIHYHLKLLSHDGKKEEFDKFVKAKKRKYFNDADIMFTLLDAEVESRRLVYDTGLHKGNIFEDMEKRIVPSSHPMANTMMFLARKGSARTMKESLEVGLDMLEEARALSEHIKPCKDTGMVLYILINILFQIYEKNPVPETKDAIIRKIDEAINVHFAEGPPFLREDYTRMLYLKMVFCYLGIGLFGNPIEHCVVSEGDLRSAESCLQIIDSSQAKFDNRRRMFYFMAQSVLHRKRGSHANALEFANLAKQKAKKCGFKKELGPILELTGDLKNELAVKEKEETEARESEIESELRALESEGVLIKNILKKPSNQWGEPTNK